MAESKGKSQTKAKNKYNAKAYDSLRIVVKKGNKELIKAHAEQSGESLNAFVNRAIDETMEKDNKNSIFNKFLAALSKTEIMKHCVKSTENYNLCFGIENTEYLFDIEQINHLNYFITKDELIQIAGIVEKKIPTKDTNTARLSKDIEVHITIDEKIFECKYSFSTNSYCIVNEDREIIEHDFCNNV